MAAYDYDLITLGAGSGGVRASRMAAAAGRKVAVVESSRVGGTCVMRGCVPKKLLVYGAKFAEDLTDSLGFGWSLEGADFDWARLVVAKNAELQRLEGVYLRLLKESGVTVVEGKGHLLDAHTVQVGLRVLTAETILVATGGRPALPDVPGIEHAVTSNEALDLMQLPEKVVIVGGGYIAVEFAGIFNALGVAVTLVLRGDTLLRGFDADIRATLAEEMTRKGVDLRTTTQVRAIRRHGHGYGVELSDGQTLDADLVMYATGRVPNTEGLGLEKAGVVLNSKGAVMVDGLSRTSVRNIWAVGDVTDRVNLTPVAIAEAMAFVRTAFSGQTTPMDYENIPSAVFSLPPVGTVGLTEAEATKRYGAVDVYLSRFKPMRNILAGREERSMMKLVVDRATDRVLGVHMVGADAPEIVQGFAVALKCGATKAQFDATVGIHPTAAEEFVTLRDKRAENGRA
ncbi:glutathione-disulfide reductase [Paramagnetospirillum magneticum]|uniref:Glutathione reductase n=1 Tax=Paramagnetospirillum magneticum (strain ATCC 700264 / AMB-1) TaxID=342108 RepID=Q2W6Q5_PARM1|nr:glutathione-disulfide reductase [Paramagnetospirillum magneticum]BAE50470.1 Glutathione reductase [Paramagnetospirillum magneticum AMB-1]